MTTELEMAKNGEFLREYGKQYFVAVSEALGIGRVKWNMVPIGNGGKNDITFYLTTEQMLALCNEIKSGLFAKKIQADTAAYPSAYKYVTGDDGSLHLNIGGAKMGCRIQMQDAKNKVNYTMAVSMDAMRDMMYKYLLCTGMTPVAPDSYYSSVIKTFELGRVERAKFRKTSPEGLTDVKTGNEVVDEEETNAPSDQPVKDVEKAPETPQKETVAKEMNKDASQDTVYTVSVKGTKSQKADFYAFNGKCDNEDVILTFKKDVADKLGWFAKFENSASINEVALKIIGEKNGKYILYKGVAK